jgi:ABC-type multidrug transport system ATPase subunit
MIIETFDLSKDYGSLQAVKKINIHVNKNSIYGLLGPNGAGKTTTLGMLTTLVRPTSGDARICGYSVVTEPEKVRSKIGLLAQGANFDPDRTGLDNVTYYAKLHGMTFEAKREANRLMDLVGMSEKKNTKVKHYSHGMVKLTGIAQALISNPEVIFLDEAISGLDPKVIIKIRELIKNLKKEATVVFSSHNLDEVEKICDHVGIIHTGELIVEENIAKLKHMKGMATFKLAGIDKKIVRSIQAIKGIANVALEEDELVVFFKDKDMTQEVIKKLLSSKVEIHGITKGKTLEKVFMEHM